MTDANITPSDFRQDSRGGKIVLNGTYTGFIKDNQDNQRNGRLRVYIPELGGDETKEANWHMMSYASPFAGATALAGNKDGDKTVQGSQISYGFWAIPPDLDNQVLCCFANGDLTQGFWFACVYQENMNHMVPGVANGISTRDDINKINLPVVTEYNKKDKDATKNAGDPKRPIFEPLHNGLDAQGLYADPERGPSTTSARREAPSKVLGLISPRSNTIHIDDNPTNEVIRLRTRSGTQLVISETTGFIYMNSKQGNSWFELSDIGIDMYSKRSISMRAEENINLHADQNIIMHGAGAVHESGGSMTQNSAGRAHHQAGGDAKNDGKSIRQNSKSTSPVKSTDPNDDKASAGSTSAQALKIAKVIQGEAGGNPANQFAVASVIYNRMGSGGFPSSDAYGTVMQGSGTTNEQFAAQSNSITPNASAVAFANELAAGNAPSGGSTGNALNFVGGSGPTGRSTAAMWAQGTNIGGNYFSDNFGAPSSSFIAPHYGK